jgi:hypothetical protein
MKRLIIAGLMVLTGAAVAPLNVEAQSGQRRLQARPEVRQQVLKRRSEQRLQLLQRRPELRQRLQERRGQAGAEVRPELKQRMEQRRLEMFKRLDRNNDGVLSREEWQGMQQRTRRRAIRV